MMIKQIENIWTRNFNLQLLPLSFIFKICILARKAGATSHHPVVRRVHVLVFCGSFLHCTAGVVTQ